MNPRNILLVLLLLLPLPLRSQPDTLGLPRLMISDAALALDGVVHICTAPAQWDRGDWGSAAAAATVTLGSATLDAGVQRVMRRNAGTADWLADRGKSYGEWWFALTATSGLYGAGLVFNDSWIRETAVLTGTAIIVSSLAASAIKIVAGRARPHLNRGSRQFVPFTLADDYGSFPSGHTVAAFSLSSVLAARINHPLATVVLYGAACLTASSRLYADEHWCSDVVFGAICASAIGRSLVLWHEGRTTGSQSFHIVPGPDAISLVYAF